MRSILLAAFLVITALGPISAAPIHGSVAPAGTCVTCLGPQTNTLWQGYVPLAGFSRYGKPLTKHLRQEVLFIDSNSDGSPDGTLLWPLVKALDAFGSWKGVQPAKQVCLERTSGTSCPLSDPSFDLSHASYRSRYAANVTVYLGHIGQCVKRLPAEAVALLKYEHWTFGQIRFETEKCWNPSAAVVNSGRAVTPLLLVGGYLQIGFQIVTPGDLEMPAPGSSSGSGAQGSQGTSTGLPFTAVHDALAGNRPTSQVPPGTLYDINSEANLIEAFICHADKLQPHSTCGRSVIKKLLKRIH